MNRRQRITICISKSLAKRLKKRAWMKRVSRSSLVCEALEIYFGEEATSSSAYDLARKAGLIGGVCRGPSDLSTNRKHFQGFGRNR